MFVSRDLLGIHYGVDDKIARFFVDREPPIDNLYWHDKSLYLQPSPGYLFIPLIAELLFRIGISREQLLSVQFIECMEQIGHITALEETKQITAREAVNKCIDLAKTSGKNEAWLNTVVDYFNEVPGNLIVTMTTPYKALHRGDIFLFSLTTIEFPVDLFKRVTELWFALISLLLLIDDADDITDDKKNNEDNAFLESGLDKEGIERIKDFVRSKLRILKEINKPMAVKIDMSFIAMIDKPHVHPLLNQ
jgi:hypothetical protein